MSIRFQIAALLVITLTALAGAGSAATPMDANVKPDSGHTGLRVSGHISANHRQWQVHDIWVYRDHYLFYAVVSDRELDPAELLADGVLDASDFDRAYANGAALLQIGLLEIADGFVVGVSGLQWQAPGDAAILLPGSATEGGLRLDKRAYARGFLRGTYALEHPISVPESGQTETLKIDLSFDVAMLAGPSKRQPGQLLPADGGAPATMLRQLQADAADPRQRDWLDHLQPSFRQRWEQIWANNGLNIADLARNGRDLIPPRLERVHGWQKGDHAQLYASDPQGVHWRIDLQRSNERWLLTDLAEHPVLPKKEDLSPGFSPSMWSQQSDVRTERRDLALLAVIGIIGLGIIFFVVLIVRGWRQQKALTAHLATHGIHSTARVTALNYAGSGSHGRCPVQLLLQWTDPYKGTLFELRSDRFMLYRKGTFDSAGITYQNACARIALLPDWPVYLDPANPEGFHRVDDLDRVRQILQDET